jgi:GAF domain-containing protein
VPNGSAYRAFREETARSLVGPAIGHVAKSGRPVWIADLASDQDFLRREQATAAGLASAFSFPVRVGNEVVAVLEFFTATRVEPIDSLLDVLMSIGTQLGWVVERQRANEAVERANRQLQESQSAPCARSRP